MVVGGLTRGETVIVAGKVEGQPWYMVSEGGAGSGFVHAGILKPAAIAIVATKPARPSGGRGQDSAR